MAKEVTMYYSKFLKSISQLIPILALSLMTACTVNPVTGKSEVSLMSPSEEVSMGAQQYQPQQQMQGGRYYIDPNLQVYVNGVGQKLAKVSDRVGLPYEFVVLNNSTPNAWALPGGKIAVNSGLLIILEDESELAAVLSHEIVHAAARHSANQMTQTQLMGVGLQVLGMGTQTNEYADLIMTASQMGTQMVVAKYGRDDESESDLYGMEYMSRAGYDPYGAVKLQQKFVQLSQGRQQDFMSMLFSSHPPSQARVDANKLTAAQYPKGEIGKSRYQYAIRQLTKDKSAYKAAERAKKALAAKDPATALAELDKAVAIQANDSEFWELRGYAWQLQGNLGKTEKSFGTAIRKNPDYFKPYALRGLARLERNNFVGAEEDLLASRAILPTQAGAYYLGELSLKRNDINTATKYFTEAAQGQGEISQKAKQRLAELSP
jgi:predicted Zn-dependent protease